VHGGREAGDTDVRGPADAGQPDATLGADPARLASIIAHTDLSTMHELRGHRRLGRILAAWLLLWFVAMAWSTSPPDLHVHAHAHSFDPVASAAGEEGPCPQHEHAGVDVHAGHASGSVSHCPLCAHGAAPAPELWANAAPSQPPSEPLRAPRASEAHGLIELSPPARGPPVLS
jgi:hypothetical protein